MNYENLLRVSIYTNLIATWLIGWQRLRSRGRVGRTPGPGRMGKPQMTRRLGVSEFRNDYFTDRWLSGESTYLTDLDRCQPSAALTRDARRGQWRMLDYETDTLAGVMLLAGPETAAPEIRYPLRTAGWRAISIGFYTQPGVSLRLLVKLSGEGAFCNLVMPQLEADWTTHSAEAEQIREIFWKVADLTGQELVLGQVSWQASAGDAPGSVVGLDAAIAYVKLTPLNEAERTTHRADQHGSDTRHLFAHNDAHGLHWMYRLTDADGIRRELDPYRDTEFRADLLGSRRGRCDELPYPDRRDPHQRQRRGFWASGRPDGCGELAHFPREKH